MATFADNEVHGKYIIQINQGQLVPGSIFDRFTSISFWKCCGRHPGAFDEQLFICINCGGLLTQEDAENNMLCKTCGSPMRNADGSINVSDVQMHKGDNAKLAELVFTHLNGLQCNADLKLMRHRSDSTYHDASRSDLSPREREKSLNSLRASIEVAFYTKGRFEKDQRGGADTLRLIRAFLDS